VSGDVKDLLLEFTQRHLDRARAEVFGAIAEEYDLHRPAFPDALIDDLVALGAHALDVGSGTGKVARALAGRGLEVLGVEVDPRNGRWRTGVTASASRSLRSKHGTTTDAARCLDGG
jgi:2-polyprenyl-3-methyl-5-hydroxy-6-metoxy-1,4-benzoquinol methylase